MDKGKFLRLHILRDKGKNEKMEKYIDRYKNSIDKLIKYEDFREIMFQTYVVAPFLEVTLNGNDYYDVIPVDTKVGGKTKHDYSRYCGYYEKNGKQKPMTPDICIAKNWKWYNKDEKDVQYFAVVEIKPFNNEKYFVCDFKQRTGEKYTEMEDREISDKLVEEVAKHLLAKENRKVIITDAIKWMFIKITDEVHSKIDNIIKDIYDNSKKKNAIDQLRIIINENMVNKISLGIRNCERENSKEKWTENIEWCDDDCFYDLAEYLPTFLKM